MKALLFGSTGAALMSVFHQLPGGKSGSGWGSAPPRWGDCAMTAEAMRSEARQKAKRDMKRILRDCH
jgi:hypothetical protein